MKNNSRKLIVLSAALFAFTPLCAVAQTTGSSTSGAPGTGMDFPGVAAPSPGVGEQPGTSGIGTTPSTGASPGVAAPGTSGATTGTTPINPPPGAPIGSAPGTAQPGTGTTSNSGTGAAGTTGSGY